MLSNSSTDESLKNPDDVNLSLDFDNFEEQILYGSEDTVEKSVIHEEEEQKYISVGDSVPYGITLHYRNSDTGVRMKNIAVRNRVLLLGVIGSFTPYCWNRHLFRVLSKSRYYEERGIDYICCISTNDAHTQRAWGEYLGCEDSVLMLADTKGNFTRALGMDVVVPWMDNRTRSRRYVLYVEDAVVSKMIVAPDDDPLIQWSCQHLRPEKNFEDFDSDSCT